MKKGKETNCKNTTTKAQFSSASGFLHNDFSRSDLNDQQIKPFLVTFEQFGVGQGKNPDDEDDDDDDDDVNPF
ncbi:hypothetical protein TYRP_020591 [Tyrophagus putrescentiae]|nr:hypothetical protein TYRP_020591 [Tyrophagus putrescentiae]